MVQIAHYSMDIYSLVSILMMKCLIAYYRRWFQPVTDVYLVYNTAMVILHCMIWSNAAGSYWQRILKISVKEQKLKNYDEIRNFCVFLVSNIVECWWWRKTEKQIVPSTRHHDWFFHPRDIQIVKIDITHLIFVMGVKEIYSYHKMLFGVFIV